MCSVFFFRRPNAVVEHLVCSDESVNNIVQTGISLSRANVLSFKHNDMNSLAAVLRTVQEKDVKRPPKKLNRRFIVVEGLYRYTGEICNLAKVVELAHRYRYRIIVDDSCAVGVLGKTGRGSVEYWNLKVLSTPFLCVVCFSVDV